MHYQPKQDLLNDRIILVTGASDGNAWLLLNDVVCRAASVLYDFGALCLKQKGISISLGR